MAGLDPAIHRFQKMDARIKSAHDDGEPAKKTPQRPARRPAATSRLMEIRLGSRSRSGFTVIDIV